MTTIRDWLMSGEASAHFITHQATNTISDINKSSKVLEDPKASVEFLEKLLDPIMQSFQREVRARTHTRFFQTAQTVRTSREVAPSTRTRIRV
jgi:hypothetical protein